MEQHERNAILQLSFFENVTEDAIDELLEGAAIRAFPSNALLFQQGERPKFMHVLLEGRVGLIGVGSDGKEVVVEILNPVESFILAAVLTDAPYLMSARVIDRARILMVPAEPLRRQVSGNASLATSMLASLAKNYRMLVRQIKDLKLRSSTQRLGCYLLALAEQHPDGSFTLPVDKRLLAARLGMTPENLSRAFSNLRAVGVRTSGQHVVVPDVEALASLCLPDPKIGD
jgi:CRP/FNR family transcriptional regulator, transcriptional activator FtrB